MSANSLRLKTSSIVKPGADMRRVFERTSKALLDISADQAADFAGNVPFLDTAAGPTVALSRRAWKSLAAPQRRILERHALPVLCGVETIEHVGGGGIRCMLAEIFPPSTGGPLP
jgi:hypothetical protein